MNTNAKEMVKGRLNEISRILDHATDAHRCSPKKSAKNHADNANFLYEEAAKAAAKINELYVQINTQIKDDISIPDQYNREMVHLGIRHARQQVMERFAKFPMAAAMFEMFMLYFETHLDGLVHFSALHKEAMADDRRAHPQFYNIDGEPKEKSK
jgi:hypothetical protein